MKTYFINIDLNYSLYVNYPFKLESDINCIKRITGANPVKVNKGLMRFNSITGEQILKLIDTGYGMVDGVTFIPYDIMK